MGKSNSPTAQKKCFFSAKSRHCVKFGTLVNFYGKLVAYSPATISTTPTGGDGNNLTEELAFELRNDTRPTLDSLLRPQDRRFVVVTFYDSGYKYHRGGRTIDLTLKKYYYDVNLQGHNPQSRFITPLSPGEDLIDGQFKPIPNYLQRQNRPHATKLTALEANASRLCTRFR